MATLVRSWSHQPSLPNSFVSTFLHVHFLTDTSWSPKTMATQCETRKILDARPSERALVLWHNSIPLFCLLEHHHHWIRLCSPSSQLGHSLDPGCLCMKVFPSFITPSLAHVTLIYRGASLIVSMFFFLSSQVRLFNKRLSVPFD